MGFDDLAPQGPMNPDADRYGRTCLDLSRRVAATMPCRLDVQYGPAPEHRLDIYAPGTTPAAPVLVFVHGGGFTHGYKEWCGFMAPAVSPSVLVAVRYRLQPSVVHPTSALDVAAALAWTKTHIAEYGGDPRRIHVGGHSAGGAIAASLAVNPDWLAALGLGADAIGGTVCLSTTFHAFAVTATGAAGYTLPPGPLPVDAESPLGRVAHARGRFFLGWGGRERQRERVERSSMAMISALRDRGVPADWVFLADADHFETHLAFADRDHAWSRALRTWLEGPAPADEGALRT
ncbi:MAG: alpha/beta hydrolase [Vicinamibacterales bacterium]